ncbi:MAG: hypothetical protein R3Y23_04410 [Bacillota bacterium]
MPPFEMYGKMEVEVHFLFNSTKHRLSKYKFIPIRWTEAYACCPPCCGYNYCKLNQIANRKFNCLNRCSNLKRSAVVYNSECCLFGFYIINSGDWVP